MDRIFNEDALVPDYAEAHSLGKVTLDELDLCLDRTGDVERVGLRLFDDAHREADFAIDPDERALVLSANDRFSDIADPNRVAIEIRDDERVVILGAAQLTRSSHTELPVDALHATRWNIDVALPQCVGDIRHDETARGKPVVIDPDPDRQTALPCYVQRRDSRQLRQPIFDLRLEQSRQLDLIEPTTAQIHPDHSATVRVRLRNDWRLDLVGQAAPRASDPVAHVGRRHVEIA